MPSPLFDISYPAHESFIAPARPRSELWRVLVGLVLAVIMFFVLSQILFAVFLLVGGAGPELDIETFLVTPSGTFMALFQIGLLTIIAALIVLLLHNRSMLSLIGDMPVALKQFGKTMAILLILSVIIMALPPYGYGDPLEANLEFSRWILLFPLALIAILIQTSAEEIFFRGYLQQQLAARFSSPFWWMIVPAALFGAAHYMPAQAGDNAWIIALWATIFGILMADLTARAGTLGPALAIHFTNNVSPLLFVAMPGQLSGLALYVMPFSLDDPALTSWLSVSFVSTLITWLAARLAIRA